MRALCWHGKEDIRCETVPDPKIQHGRDAIIKVTSCAICGSDLHLMGGFVPNMKSGDILGHETMGEVVEVGRDNTKLKVGDRVVVPFTIGCGDCRMCRWGLWSCCERSNPAGAEEAKQTGYPTAGLFGYSHTYGGFPGGQAEYLRVPYADVGPIKVPDGLTRRTSPVPLRHLSDRVYGRGELQYSKRRHHRGFWLRAGRAVRHQVGLPPWRRAGDCNRHRSRAACAGSQSPARKPWTTPTPIYRNVFWT